jgi:hypothetical protein
MRRDTIDYHPAIEFGGNMMQGESNVQRRATEMISQNGFMGVQVESFEQAGRSRLIALLMVAARISATAPRTEL